MKILSYKVENQTAYFTIEADAEQLEEYLDKAWQRMANWEAIEGFEKGKAPREVVEKHYGREKIFDEASKELIPRLYARALKDYGLEAIGEPTAKVTQKEPLVFDLVVPLNPVVELGDYRSIRIPPVKPAEPTAKDVEIVLEHIRHKFATYDRVDRPAKLGDILTVNIDSTVMDKPFIRGNNKQFPLSKDYPPGLPEFHTHFLGAKTNEEMEFKLRLPDDYVNEVIAGKEASFKVKILEIHEERIPELTDKLAQMAAPDLRTVEELRARIEKNMKLDCEEKAKIDFEEKLMATLIERSRLEVSPVVIETETKALMKEGLEQLRESCENDDEYRYKLRGLSKDELHARYEAVVRKRILWNLVLTEVAKKENIVVGQDEIEKEIEKMIQGVSLTERAKQRKAMYQADYQENVKSLISARKTIALLSQIASSPADEGAK